MTDQDSPPINDQFLLEKAFEGLGWSPVECLLAADIASSKTGIATCARDWALAKDMDAWKKAEPDSYAHFFSDASRLRPDVVEKILKIRGRLETAAASWVRLRSLGGAEDFAQETLFLAELQLHTLRERSVTGLLKWLLRSQKNRLVNLGRRRDVMFDREQFNPDYIDQIQLASLRVQDLRNEQLQQLLLAIDTLSPMQRTVVVRKLDGWSLRKIADFLVVKERRVKYLWETTLKALRKYYRSLEE